MALRGIYESFLARPEAELLAQESSLHYVATTTTHSHPEDIIKHLTTVGRAIKKSEKTLGAVEGPDSLCLDIETKLEFVSGGGPYLLGVDDSFFVDRTVTFPAVHIVQFDSQNKVSQIRVYWDQGSLLKQVEIIGPRNRGWPIRDGAEQMRLINSSISAATKCAPPAPRTNKSNGENKKPAQVKRNGRDPHSSLSLFDPSSNGPDESRVAAPRSSFSTAKPRTHTYGDIFGDGEIEVTPPKPVKVPETPRTNMKQHSHFEFGEGEAPPPSTTRTTTFNHFEFGEGPAPESPLKHAKARNIFEHEEELPDGPQEGFKPKKPHPNSASHFEFGEEPLKVERPIRPVSTKNMSQWDFEDFVTPEKTTRRGPKPQEVRHFGWSDDEQTETPEPRPRVVHPRRDAAVHFKLQDHPTPGNSEKKAKPMRGAAANKRSGLYENHLYDEEEEDQPSQQDNKAPLAAATNGAHRRKDFDSHWVMKDEPSPCREPKTNQNKHVASDRMTAVKMMESHWGAEDEDTTNNKPAVPAPQRTNRMSRNVNQRSWGFGDDEE